VTRTQNPLQCGAVSPGFVDHRFVLGNDVLVEFVTVGWPIHCGGNRSSESGSIIDRPVCKWATLVEMAVQYADVNQPQRCKCAFDVGDYGLGYCFDWSELGCDGLGCIHYATLMQCSQMPVDIQSPRRNCLYTRRRSRYFKEARVVLEWTQ
jgi:Copper amine oxidase, enzyme domain